MWANLIIKNCQLARSYKMRYKQDKKSWNK